MRTRNDRIRHAVAFEVIGLVLVVGVGSVLLDIEAHKLGLLGVVMSFLAMGWNYLFNLIFDRWLKHNTGQLQKSFKLRLVHAFLFEGGLVLVSVPMIAVYLDMTLLNAFLMDIGFTLFYLVYAFFYNWVYDKAFPLPNQLQNE